MTIQRAHDHPVQVTTEEGHFTHEGSIRCATIALGTDGIPGTVDSAAPPEVPMRRASLSLRYGDRFELLDQQALPEVERWCAADEVADTIDHIRALRVRGAPAIGVAAALCLARRARLGDSRATLESAAAGLREARPTAVNLAWAVDRMRGVLRAGPDAVEAEALAIFDQDVALCEAMATHGLPLIADGDQLLTHCNTGGLATAGIGTALGLIRRAWEAGRRIHVWVDETRPLLQGARLTCWELGRLGIPHTLITDGAAASLMRAERVDKVLVGADRVAANGDVVNKVGTWPLAALAHMHGLPFYVVAPWSTVDLSYPSGEAIPIEERPAAEVLGIAAGGHALRWAPAGTAVYNPAFDLTPGTRVTALVLDTGVVTRDALMDGALSRIAREQPGYAAPPHAGSSH